MRVAVVTGGAGAIGSAVVERLTAEGWIVHAPTHRQMDLQFPHSLDRFARAVERLDALIHCAAIHGPIGPLTDPADWPPVFQTVVFGPLHLTRLLLPKLSPTGAIIFLSGGGAVGPRPRFSAYACAKAAVVRLASQFAAEYPTLKVNAVAPGVVKSRLHHSTLAAHDAAGSEYADALRVMAGTHPKQVPPTMAARCIAWLVSDPAAPTGRLIAAPFDPWQDWQHGVPVPPLPAYSLGRLLPSPGQ